ncbi:MAG: pilus assembly protein, partial [Burkholderiales bacterium]
HSQPVIVTYDPAVSNGQYLFYVSSEGMLHAVDTANGKEKWAFMIEEALPKLGALRDDLVGEQVIVADMGPSVFLRDGDKDGEIADDVDDQAILVFGQRRGGRALYALDIKNKDTPKLLWKIDNATTGFSELGQTWSTPAFVKLRATTDPVIVFGGGYDPNQDNRPVAAADTMGRALFVVNAVDGSLLKAFGTADGMAFSVPSDPAVLNSDLDAANFADRVYVGDTGGNVWRFDINDADPDNWVATHLADLSGADTPKRKILFPPAAVKQLFISDRFDAVYIGTGDRENPLNAVSNDMMFMIKDREIGLSSKQNGSCDAGDLDPDCPIVFGTSSLLDITDNQLQIDLLLGSPAEQTNAQNQLLSTDGWVLRLGIPSPPAAFPGFAAEKVTNPPQVFGNVLSFATFTPVEALNACTPPGTGKLYLVNALNGGVIDIDKDGQIDPNTDTRTVSSFYVQGYVSPGSVIVRGGKIIQLHAGGALLHGRQVGTVGGGSRVYWYQEPEN